MKLTDSTATYTESIVQLESDNTYTRDQVPVYLKVYLRYQLEKPLLLAIHGYATVFDALQDKVRSILTQILAHLGTFASSLLLLCTDMATAGGPGASCKQTYNN